MTIYYLLIDLENDTRYEFDTYAEASAKYNKLIKEDTSRKKWLLLQKVTLEKISEYFNGVVQ